MGPKAPVLIGQNAVYGLEVTSTSNKSIVRLKAKAVLLMACLSVRASLARSLI
jgi:hypothetical protein